MATRALTPLGRFVKWIVVPVGSAVGGFYLLGPRMSDILPRLSGSVIGTSAVAESTPKKRSYMAPIVDVHRSRAGQYDSGPDVQITAGQRFRRRRDRRDQTDVGNISDQPRKSTRKKRSHPVSPVEPSAREPFENYIAPSETAPTTGAAPGPDAGN